MGKTKIKTYSTGFGAPAMANFFGLGGEYAPGRGFKVTGPLGGRSGPAYDASGGIRDYGQGEGGLEGFMGQAVAGEAMGESTAVPSEGQYAPTIFDREAYGKIADYLTRGPGEYSALAGDVASTENLRQGFEDWQGVSGDLTSALREGLQTGFRTDIDPWIAEQKRQYYQDLIPQTIEDFIGTSGISSSDFGAALAGGAQDIATRMGAGQVEADEAAAARRAKLMGQAPEIGAQQLAMPGLYASDILGIEQGLAGATEGGMLFDAFQQLGGLDTGTQTFVKPGTPSSKAQKLGAAGGVISGIT